MNLESIKQTFLLESEELLAGMEEYLLQLEKDPGNEEAIHTIFRAVHTIKGSSGMFGYDNIVHFTHTLETMMDRLRQKEAVVTPDLIATLLKCHDHIETLVEFDTTAEEGQAVPEEYSQRGQELFSELSVFFQGGKQSVTVKKEESAKPTQPKTVEPLQRPTNGIQSPYWHISLRFAHSVLADGLDPFSFIHYLKKIGSIKNLYPVHDSLPDADLFNPEIFYLGFEIDLDAQTDDEQTVRSVFEFLEEDATIHIFPPHSASTLYEKVFQKLPESRERLTGILMKMGTLVPADLEQTSSDSPAVADAGDVEETEPKIKQSTKDHPEKKKEVPAKTSGKEEQSKKFIRIEAAKLDLLINLVGELVITEANISQIAKRENSTAMLEAASAMDRLIEELRDNVMNIRMVQIGETFRKFERIVRDISRDLKKEVELLIKGGETELDKNLIDNINDPLMHLIRNSLDHGLEDPEDREAAGKPRKGTILLNAFHDTGSIVIEISDDGKGLGKDKILAKAVERGLANKAQYYSDSDIYHFIFEPGFSTAEKLTNISGRGVGMDVVRRNIEALRGTVDIDSTEGKNTIISIRLPLTLAIIDGFIVTVGDAKYVIPLDMVTEAVEVKDIEKNSERGGNFISLRGELLPYLRLNTFFREKNMGRERENVIVVTYGQQKAGLVVDDLLGESQTVIKPLGKIFDQLHGISGATIMGNGDVALILDIPRLIEHAINQQYG